MKLLRAVLACAAAMLLMTDVAVAAPLSFDTFVSTSNLSATLGNNATIGFAYAGNKFVGSVYFGPNNAQLYQTDLSGGNVQKFGAPIGGASGEIYVSSSLGLGGFGSREVFAGPESVGSVFRFTNDGATQTPFVTGLIGGVRSIAFDPYGLYGFAMIVATSAGRVYKVDSAGVATVLAVTGEDTEGLSFAPQAFGPVAAGTLVVASEGSGSIRAITPGGAQSVIATVASAEMVSFVPLNLGISGNPLEGFYAANYASNVIKAGAEQFLDYRGDMIITGETTHLVTRVRWNGSQFVNEQIGQFPGQPEDGIFVTAAILNPGCEITNTCGGSSVPEPSTLSLAWLGTALVGFATLRRRRRLH